MGLSSHTLPGSEETRTDGERSGSDQASNVVRIPRDWFGPRDELVPFGPKAWEASEENASSGAADPVDANLFWGEHADSVHDVLDVPPATVGRRSRRSLIFAAALAAVVAGVGITFLVLPGSAPPVVQSAAAPSTHRASGMPNPLIALRAVARSAMRHQRVSPPTKGVRAAASLTSGTEVVYRPRQGQASADVSAYRPDQSQSGTSVGYSASQPSSGPAAGSSQSTPSGPATVATTPSSTGASQPAFGSSGALGPMSSPDG